MSQLKGVPRSRIYRLLRKGEVRVNKGRIKPDYKIKAGDQVRIPPVRVASPTDADKSPTAGLLKQIESAIIYQDDSLMIINKPSGIAVHGGSGIQFGIIESLRALYPQEKNLERAIAALMGQN